MAGAYRRPWRGSWRRAGPSSTSPKTRRRASRSRRGSPQRPRTGLIPRRRSRWRTPRPRTS
eukprot:12518805-Alexandrium_andersonii.AAC.1